MQLRRFGYLALLALAGHLACGPDPAEEQVSDVAQKSVSPNHLHPNHFSISALTENGLFKEGLPPGGVFSKGLPDKPLPNGSFLDVLWKNELWQNNGDALKILRENGYTRQFLKAVYECAMRPDQETVLDEGPTADHHANLELRGLVGLAPEWGGPDGKCDKGCRRWVSACLLARTNAYGVSVNISMRAPDNAPQEIKKALLIKGDEGTTHTLFEGAFYGDMFEIESRNGVEVMAPKLYACAGRGSNVPEVTKRFYSSQGAGGPIKVVDTCEVRPESASPGSACTGKSQDSEAGAVSDCYTDKDVHEESNRYREAITVYLEGLIEVCGNSVCEKKESEEETCPSDCHPGGWASSNKEILTADLGAGGGYPKKESPWAKTSAVDPVDGSVVLAGITKSTVNFGGGDLDTGEGEDQLGVLAKFGADGALEWARRFGPLRKGSIPGAVAMSPKDGGIVVALTEAPDGAGAEQARALWLGKFDKWGVLEWSEYAGSGAAANSGHTVRALAVDGDGSMIVAGVYQGTVTFGGTVLNSPPGESRVFVLKVSSGRAVTWARSFGSGSVNEPKALAVGPDGDSLLSLSSNGPQSPPGLLKLAKLTGDTVWSRRGWHDGVTVGPSGKVYAAGALAAVDGKVESFAPNTYDFTPPPSARGGDFFAVEYAKATGEAIRLRVVTPACRANPSPCKGRFDGRHIALDKAGNVVVGVVGGNGETINFGQGDFRTYRFNDIFVAAFSPALIPLWAKHMPVALEGTLRGMHIDNQKRVVLAGTFAGSMLVDDRHLVSHIPEDEDVGNTFLASFLMPSTYDDTRPDIDNDSVPLQMVLEATSKDGAEVYFVAPLALDAGEAGVDVVCTPPPGSPFPLGTTNGVCRATDPLGNSTSATFKVEVVDTLGPAFSQVPPATPFEATGPDGARVTFDPRAVDLVDGERTVTCNDLSNKVYPIGTKAVSCSASDTRGHLTKISFDVVVADTTPPALTQVPGPITVVADSPEGAFVMFPSPVAFDLVDLELPATCAPQSGSQFKLGTTKVVCESIDSRNNRGEVTFNVTVVDKASDEFVTVGAAAVNEASTGGVADSGHVLQARAQANSDESFSCEAAREAHVPETQAR